MQSPQAATVPIFRVLMRFWLPIRPGGLPYAGAVPMPSAFPHTFWQIPTGRPSPPYVFRGSAIQSASSKKSGIDSDETSDRPRKSPTNPAQQTPRTCVTPPQIKRQSSPYKPSEPASHLRKFSAGQATQILQTGGGWHLLHAHTSTYARTFTGMLTLARQCRPKPYPVHVLLSLHGHGHIPVACLHFDPHAFGHVFAETSGRSPQIPNRFRHASSLSRRSVHSNAHPTNSLKFHRPTTGAWARHGSHRIAD